MLRRLELLVNEVRESTDTQDINSIGVYEVMRYFNDGQKQIQKIIFTANPSADVFAKQAQYTIADRSQSAYTLPADIYAHNSVNSIMSTKGDRIAQTLTRVAFREKETLWGYALFNKQFILTSPPSVSTITSILVNYIYKVPTVSYRLAEVASVASQVVTIDSQSLIEDDAFQTRYDKYCIVDKDGNIKQTSDFQNQACQLLLTDVTGLDYTFEGDLTQVAAGDYLVCGEFGTSHSHLPTECEPYLMTYVQRRILNKLSSNQVASENIFTMEERADLEDLFKDTVKDPLYPVSTDTDYLGM